MQMILGIVFVVLPVAWAAWHFGSCYGYSKGFRAASKPTLDLIHSIRVSSPGAFRKRAAEGSLGPCSGGYVPSKEEKMMMDMQAAELAALAKKSDDDLLGKHIDAEA